MRSKLVKYDKNNIERVYRSDEFGSFTDGIEKKSSFKRILGGGDNPYEKEPVKQELEQDPIQVPEWHESSRELERERNIVLRPVINYDNADVPAPMPEHRFLDGSAPAPEPAAAPQAFERTRGVKAEPPSVIHNQDREPKQSAPAAAEQAQPAKSSIFDMEGAKDADLQAQEERQIAIYDSAEKIQGAETESAADAGSPEPAAAADSGSAP